MDVRIVVETTFENGTTKTRRLGRLSQPFRSTQPEGYGLLLEDAKSMLWKLQQAILIDQIEEISKASRGCPDCNKLTSPFKTIRTARSRTSGVYLFVVLFMMLHPTHELEPTANRVRFNFGTARGLEH